MVFKEPKLEFKTVWSGVRPPRVAILVPTESKPAEWLDVIAICSQVWGGMFFVVAPTDGTHIEQRFWDLLKLYDPDFMASLGDVPIDDGLRREMPVVLNPFPYLPVPTEPYHIMSIWPDNIPYPLTKVAAVADERLGGCVSPVVVGDPWVELLAYSHIGRMTPNTMEQLKDRKIAIGYPDYDLHKDPNRQSRLWDLAWEQPEARHLDEWGKLPRDISCAYLGAYYRVTMNWYNHPVILVVGQTTDDFCLFYSLYHMRPGVFWAVPDLVDAVPETGHVPLDDLRVSATFHLAHHIHEKLTETADGRPFLVTSVSKNVSQLESAVKRLERARLVKGKGKTLPELAQFDFDVKKLLQFRHTSWERNHHLGSTAQAVQLVNARSAGQLEVRPKHVIREFDAYAGENPIWVFEIAVEGYQLPRRRVFNDKVLSFGRNAPDTRVSSSGIAYVGVTPFVLGGADIEAIVAKPILRTMGPFELFSHLFEEHGYEIAISDKGTYQEGTIQRFGGLDSFATTFRSARWPLLTKYLDQSENQPGVTDQGTKIRDRRYLDYASVAKQLGTDKEETVRETLGEFLDEGILQRGFTLKCRECRQFDWYDVGAVSDVFRCSRCGSIQRYDPEPLWTYRLNELVFQCLKNNAHCHILTLDRIRQWATNGNFLSIPALDVFQQGDRTNPFAEIDVACIVDGQIVLGECKTTGSITRVERQQLAKYETLAKQLQAGVLVLSTLSEPWTAASMTFIEGRRQHLSQFDIDLRVLTGPDMTPRFTPPP